MKGYLRDDEATSEVMCGDWLKTGDLGSIDPSGHLILAGRQKNVIVTSAGKNVYPEDLEIMLERYPGIKEAGVFELDSRPAAVFAVDEEHFGKVKGIIKEFNARVSGHNQITRYAVVEELPRTPLGKIALRQLPEIFQNNEVK